MILMCLTRNVNVLSDLSPSEVVKNQPSITSNHYDVLQVC